MQHDIQKHEHYKTVLNLQDE